MNRDSIRYALNVFPRTPEWASLVDAYYISKDFEVSTLENLFLTFELHESRIAEPNEVEKASQNIALKARTNDSDSEASIDESEAALMVRRFNKFFKI